MKLKLHQLTLVCLSLTFFLSLLSCQQDTVKTSPSKPFPTDQAKNPLGPTCPKGENRNFDAQVEWHHSGSKFRVFTDVPPFQAKDCLCKSSDYVIIFESLPSWTQLTVRSTDGEDWEHTHVDNPYGSDTLFIHDIQELPDRALTANIKFLNVEASPVIEDGSGLCIVDDLDGYSIPYDTVSFQYFPYKITLPPTLLAGDSIKAAFLPESMTY